MTKEELEREARINLKRRFGEFFPQLTISYVMGAEPREKRIDDLEKENAELKDYRLFTLAKQQTGMSKYALNLEHKLSWYDDQLTEAKRLLASWISDKPYTKSELKDLIADTEQFLNSEVEK